MTGYPAVRCRYRCLPQDPVSLVLFLDCELGNDDAAARGCGRRDRRFHFGKLFGKEVRKSARAGAARSAGVRHPYQKHQGFQDLGVAQPGIAGVLHLGFAIFLHHVDNFGGDSLLDGVLGGLVVVQPGIHPPFIAASQTRDGGDQVAVIHGALASSAVGKREAQAHDEVLVFVEELFGHLDLQDQGGRVEVAGGARLFVFAGLLEVRAVAGAVERDLALFAATLGANAAMDGGAETLFLADLADRAGHQKTSFPFLLLH